MVLRIVGPSTVFIPLENAEGGGSQSTVVDLYKRLSRFDRLDNHSNSPKVASRTKRCAKRRRRGRQKFKRPTTCRGLKWPHKRVGSLAI